MTMPMVQATRTKITPSQAGDSRERRKEARMSVLAFGQYVNRQFLTPPHVRLIGSKLQEVALYIKSRGQKGIGRLMIMMPPRHGKSELCSRLFPAWMLGIHPDCQIILTSYGADLAVRNSRAVREIVEGEHYKALFGRLSVMKGAPVELSSDSRSAQSWSLSAPHLGTVTAAGVGGGITGLGADLLVIDDPFKNREEAESEARRELVDDWYKSSARTRLSPWGAVIVFHTRWHPDDEAGRLIARMVHDEMADQWEVVNLPALALDAYAVDEEDQRRKMRDGIYLPLQDVLGRRPGEALWPEQFSRESLLSTKADVGDYDFEALFQQSPYPKSGKKYQREWFRKVAQLPNPPAAEAAAPQIPQGDGVAGERRDLGGRATIKFAVRMWDKANSSKGDFTAGVLMAFCSDGNFYILDVVRGQWTSHERDQKMLKTAQADRDLYGGLVKIWHQQDPGSAGKDSAEATNRVLLGFNAKFETVTGDKATRSEPLESAMQGGLVFLLKGSWNDAFVDECVAFDRGKYDDQVDAASGAYSKLLEMIGKKRESRVL
jgi:predicted phage terminase large subunit-like protein